MATAQGTRDGNTVWRHRRARATLVAATVVACTALFGPDILTAAFSGNRTIQLHNIHTKETLSVQYKKDGQYIPDAMDKIDWILRDWRRNEKTKMDPRTIDILWEMHTELGSNEPIHIISGYRSRGTNDMLRRTVGGQASESQHTTGKAVDVTFPDVPLRNIRYAAMVREMGGVGYYPTSGIPFVHVDTGRVRAWPRLPRYELALLFPNGSSKHAPADGGALSPEDVRVAQSRYKDLAVQVAAFFDLRKAPKDRRNGGVLVADTGRAIPPAIAQSNAVVAPAVPKPVAAPPRPIPAGTQVASLAPVAIPSPREPVTAASPAVPKPAALTPKLVAEPKLVERPSKFTPAPTEDDRNGLKTLVALAAASPELDAPRLIREPAPAVRQRTAVASPSANTSPVGSVASAAAVPAPVPYARPAPPTTIAEALAAEPPANQDRTLGGTFAAVLADRGKSRTSWMQLAAIDPATAKGAIAGDGSIGGDVSITGDGRTLSDVAPPGWGNGFAAAPAFDDEHPEELHYRPFPVAPLLTATASIDEPAISRMTAPDVVKILDLLDQPSAVPPMRFLPGRQTAETMWAQQFKGQPVAFADASFGDGAEDLPTKLIPRGVKTSAR
jgi:uncharacterized protein YcbK (DUF882 family)